MKKIVIVVIASVLFYRCTDANEQALEAENKNVTLRSDTINVVRLTDTLEIHESNCRGCAYEVSTHFDISDSAGIIKLLEIVTTDNNPPDMDGGSISKDLVLVPQKTGFTNLKLYKFWSQQVTAQDSARFSTYSIEVQN
ncbi:MAG: hypothetical protein WDN26_24695 [Chitinophagaceae bacterium]